MKPIKTYSVTVDGFAPVQFSARSSAKARALCYRAFLSYDDRCTFRRFLEKSSIRRVADPDGIGQRVMIDGRPATKVIPSGGYNGIYLSPAYMRDDSDVIFTAHPSDVSHASAHRR